MPRNDFINTDGTINYDNITSKPDFDAHKANNVINVKEYGAKCDGVTDDTSAIQNAINAAPSGTTILVGNCLVHTALTVNKHIKFKGYSFINGNDTGASATSRMYFDQSLVVAINSTGGNVEFEDIIVKSIGAGSNGIGVQVVNSSLVLNNAVFQGFSQAIQVTSGYYCKLQNSYIGYCPYTSIFDNCYNINSVNMTWQGTTSSIELKNGSTMNIFGGSIENFSGYGIRLTTGSRVNLYSVYFEGDSAYKSSNSCIHYNDDNCSVNAIGCHVYLTSVRYFTYTTRNGIRLFSRNNFFVYPSDTSAVDVYLFSLTATNSIVDIAGDNWDTTAGANVTYCGTGIFAQSGIFDIVFPPTHPLYGKSVNTKNNVQKTSQITPVVDSGTIVNFANNGGSTPDPLGIHVSTWGYNPYRAIYQNAQWEKVGARLPNQVDSTAIDVATLKADFNSLLAKLRANGIMI